MTLRTEGKGFLWVWTQYTSFLFKFARPRPPQKPHRVTFWMSGAVKRFSYCWRGHWALAGCSLSCCLGWCLYSTFTLCSEASQREEHILRALSALRLLQNRDYFWTKRKSLLVKCRVTDNLQNAQSLFWGGKCALYTEPPLWASALLPGAVRPDETITHCQRICSRLISGVAKFIFVSAGLCFWQRCWVSAQRVVLQEQLDLKQTDAPPTVMWWTITFDFE